MGAERLIQPASPDVLVAAANQPAVPLPPVSAHLLANTPLAMTSILDLPLPNGPMLDRVDRMCPARYLTSHAGILTTQSRCPCNPARVHPGLPRPP